MSNLKAARRVGGNAPAPRQNEYLTALHETALALMNRLDVEDLVETIVVRAAQLFDTAHGYVYLVEPGGAEIAVKVGVGIFKEHVGSPRKPGEGIAGKIWQSGQPLAVRDYSAWPGRAPQFEHSVFRAVVGVPLTSGDQVIGVIGMAHIEAGCVFGDAEIDLLVRFAQLASIALDNARLYAAAQQELAARARAEQQLREGERRARELAAAAEHQARELTLLGQVRSAMASEIELSRLFRVAVEAIPAVFGYTLVSLYMCQGDQLALQSQVGYPQVIERIPLDQGICWRVVRSGEPVLLEDVRDDPTFLGAIEGISSEVCVPLFDQGRAVGVLNVESTGGVRLSEADLRLMIALSQHVGIAIGRARLYAEARQERDFSSAVVDTMSSLVVVLDRQGRIARFNRACERTTGYVFDEVRGRHLWDLFLAAEDIEPMKAIFEYLSTSQFPRTRENVWVTRDRQQRLIAWLITALLDAAGVPEYVIGTGVDITERRKAERALRESEQRFRILFEHSPDAIILIDPHHPQISWPIVECNDGACQMNEYTHDELIGQSIDILNGVEAPPQERVAYLERLRREGTIQLEALHRRKDGTSLPIEVVSSLISIEGRELVLGIDRDISERKRAEVALAQARDQALEASRLKSEFLATMSHEIRTPMNGIMGMTELLLDTSLDAEQQEFATVVHDSAQALLTIINDILDFSKIEAGKLILDDADFDLLATVEGTVDLLSTRARAKQLSLMAFVDPAIPRMLRGDSMRLRQVLLNLVGNAVKFTELGEVVVRAALERATDTDAFVRFSVEDSGIGFSEATRRQLFQPFTQADGSVTRKYGGTGLGLAICRRLVELMGGEIGATSVEGQGSTFWFTARIERSHSAPDAAGARQANLLNLRALVVDDRQTNQAILLSYLRAWGLAADSAAGGVAALVALRRATVTQTPYDLVITDLVMPEMDGFALARMIQRDAVIGGTRLILLIAFDDRGQGKQAIQSGFGAYLTKPVKQSQLFEAIAGVMANDRRLAAREEPLPVASGQLPCTTGDGQPTTDDGHRAGQLILLVEDNLISQRLALHQLERLGYLAQVASNGREALEAVTSAAQLYALVLMDCQMPEMDGFAASRAIREWERDGGSRIPIVAMTANAMQGDREACLAAGMDDYLSKPVYHDDL